MLEGDRVGDLRLQNGLAAAVAGLSAREFFDLPEKTKESHRRRFVHMPIHQQLSPHLIIYLGSPATNQDKPAKSGQIQSHKEFYPWDAMWDSQDISPTTWDWMTSSLDPQAHFIFLSATFVTWPTHWFRESPVNFASYKSTLLLHLKITLYHEFAHYLQNLVCQFVLSQPWLIVAFRPMVFTTTTPQKSVSIIPPRHNIIIKTNQGQLGNWAGRQRPWHLGQL